MNGIHDMGGMHGFGPIVREEHEPVFHEEWEGRAFGMRRLYGATMPLPYPGVSRTFIESIPPGSYLAMSYYERWLESTVQRAIAEGVITAEELAARVRRFADDPTTEVPRRESPQAVSDARSRLTQDHPASNGRAPRFKAGDAVVAINVSRFGHNRLPRYIRGRRGVIERVNGLTPIEDERAFAADPTPQAIYTVGFDGGEVWGPECEPNVRVYLELWEDYLQPT